MKIDNQKLLSLYLYVCLGIFFVLTYSSYHTPSYMELLSIILLAVIAAVFELRPISLPNGEELSFVSPLLFIPGVLYGFFTVSSILIIFCTILIASKPAALKPILFNGVQYALATYVGIWVYQLTGGEIGSIDLNNVLSYGSYIFSYPLVNLVLVNIFIYIRNRTLISVDVKSTLIYLNLMAFAILITKVVELEGIMGIVLFTVVLWGLTSSYRTYYRMYNDFKQLSIKDGLTNLYNHRFFQQKLDELLKSDEKVSLFLLDLDYFKVYNDKFGHPQGDTLLREVSDLLVETTPDDAFVCRYGGEEFAVILPEMEVEYAKDLGEKIRESIYNKEFFGAEDMPFKHITVSLGISSNQEGTIPKGKLIKAADLALYEAKKSRNKVVVSAMQNSQDNVVIGQ
ncbi:GGDEF domain-containing protein [Bacillus sp. SCS-153A]|uniref:GGDEF domain-containing protein n=1 Tax=Rossellomorea sedimentorum TaxID=3115294 RepID=UPI0039062ABE